MRICMMHPVEAGCVYRPAPEACYRALARPGCARAWENRRGCAPWPLSTIGEAYAPIRRGRYTVTSDPSATNADTGSFASARAKEEPYRRGTSATSDASAADHTRQRGCRTSYSTVPPSRWRVYPQKCSVMKASSDACEGRAGAPDAVAETSCQRDPVRHPYEMRPGASVGSAGTVLRMRTAR